jgi:hypothetical protein
MIAQDIKMTTPHSVSATSSHEFQRAVLSGGDAVIILNWRAGRDWHVFEPSAKECLDLRGNPGRLLP